MYKFTAQQCLFGISFMTLMIVIASFFVGCTAARQADTWYKDHEPQIVGIVDLGLAVSGQGELVPINDAGVAAVDALRASIVAKQGITPAQAQQLTTAVDLGLTATKNGKLVSANDEVSADLQSALSAAQSLK